MRRENMSDAMVTYELTAAVEAHLIDAYEGYMTAKNIADVLATGYFVSATFSRSGNRYRIRYEAASREMLDKYLKTEADRLRADFAEHFPNGIEISRENWEILSSSPA